MNRFTSFLSRKIHPIAPGLFPRRPLIRDMEADDLFESFLVSAVASVIGIRAYLSLMHYPQIGGGGVHIAHVLWGGFLMLAALVILLGFVNRPVKRLAAIIGGIGFGAFIDELGKFVTSDNNYFFQPSIAIIYLLFIALYLITRSIVRRRTLTREESIMNGLELVKEAIENDLDPEEQKRAAALLDPYVGSDPTAAKLRELIRQLETVPPPRPGFLTLIQRKALAGYLTVVRQRWFPTVLIGFFAVQFSTTLVTLGSRVLSDQFSTMLAPLSFYEWGELIGSTVSALLIIIGIIQLRKSRRAAYEYFIRALLVSIFVTRVFIFSTEQVSAVLGLGFDILLLIAIRTLRSLEKTAQQK